MTRLLFLLHRYLGIGVGVLMAMWCLSGLVMMYVSYPALSPRERLAHLTPIAWGDCCRLSAEVLADTDTVDALRIEMLGGRPVLALSSGADEAALIDLTTGSLIQQVSLAQAASVAATYRGRAAPAPRLLKLLDYDQWTLEGISADGRPLYHFALGDAQHTDLYVSSSTGQAVQLTTRPERFWNWLGSVPHWLYFADLRYRAQLWSQVVIYTSLLGCFLTAIGLYIGVRQLLCRPAGRWSPYRGFNLWHHLAGLVFGIFTLTWVLSGLLSMNPWGLLEGGGAVAERARLHGSEVSGAELRAALQTLAAAHPGNVVSMQSAPLHGRLYWIASAADGRRWRLDASGAAAPLEGDQRSFIVAALSGHATLTNSAASLQLITRGDNYYFGHHGDPVRFPVYRLVLSDDSGTHYYVDPISGELLAKVDSGARDYRWWHDALHRMDFAALIRGRPQWDVLMWLLMSGVTTVCVTGTYLGYRRLTR